MSGLTVQAHILVMEVISSQCGTNSNRSIMAQWNLGCTGGYDVGLLISSTIVCRHLQEVIILLLGCFGLVLKRRTCIYLCLCASVPLCIDFLEIERLICKLQNMDRYSCNNFKCIQPYIQYCYEILQCMPSAHNRLR